LSNTETELTYTDTITQPPPDAVVTVFYDPDQDQYSTYWGDEIETVYEVIVFTTTTEVEVVSSAYSCGWNMGGDWKHKRTALPGEVVPRGC